jgi:hypothetical protein
MNRKLLSMLAATAASLGLMTAPAFALDGNFACDDDPVSSQGITPDAYPGNFVSSDDQQVCYDMSEAGFIGEVTGDMFGFKIDPPVDYSDGNVSTAISSNGRCLAWEAKPGVQVLAFIIKGGPNYHVYDYVGTELSDDAGLISPRNGRRVPQISHYNVCYEKPPGDEGQGCTPGYWRNHADRWFGADPTDDFDVTFGVDLFDPNITLGMAINNPNLYGTFAFHAVAALLNSYGGVPNSDGTSVTAYPYTTAEVIQMVKDAVANDTANDTKDLFAAANELGCPLSGTKAVKVQ